MQFTKMHGLGNDYVYVSVFDEHVDDASALARRLSDRFTGIGSDGLILICPSSLCDLKMEIYNADGSRAEMCGNGLRCVAKYAVERGLVPGPEVRIETDAGVRSAQCVIDGGKVREVCVDMGCPTLATRSLPSTLDEERIVEYPMSIAGSTYNITCVSLGNPHAVIFVDDFDVIELDRVGPALEHSSAFPQRINTHIVRVDKPDHVTMKTWERGSGATRACGSGACAVCVAGAVTERSARTITATLPGGDLKVEWRSDDRVFMTGPAEEVFTGDWPD